MKWIARKDIKVDRVACPWLIKRFVDPQAEFLCVEEKDLLEKAKQEGAAADADVTFLFVPRKSIRFH
jgi:hypothetical protein